MTPTFIDLFAQRIQQSPDEAALRLQQHIRHIVDLLKEEQPVALPNIGMLQMLMRKEIIHQHTATHHRQLLPPRLIPCLLPESATADDTTLQSLADTIAEMLTLQQQADVPQLGIFARNDDHLLSFHPDPQLLQQLNSPFAQFKPIDLQTDTSIPDTQEIAAESEEEADRLALAPLLTAMANDGDADDRGGATERKDTGEDGTPDKGNPPGESEVQASMTPAMNEDNDADVSSIEMKAPEEFADVSAAKPKQAQLDHNPMSVSTEAAPTADTVPVAPVEAVSAFTDAPVATTPRQRPWWHYAIAATVVVAIVALVVVLATRPSAPEITQQPADTQPVDTLTQAQKDEMAKQQRIAHANHTVEWAPYVITDIYDTIHVDQSTTATRLALRYGGPGTEHYIRALNDDREEFQVDDEVLIPIIERKTTTNR